MSTTNETIEKLTTELRKSKSALNRDSTILLIVAILLFAVFLGYFIFGYNKFKEISEPNLLMDAAESIVNDNIKDVRRTLQNEVTQNADKWVEQLSVQAVGSVDKMRTELEKFVTSQLKEKIEKSVELADPEFEKILADNNEVLKKAFSDFGKDEKTSEELVEIIANEVDARLKTNLEKDANEVLNMMIQLKAKMRKLRSGVGLDEEESLERQILATVRLIQSKSGK